MTDHDNEARLRELLGEAYPPGDSSFTAGFADRVMTRRGSESPHADLSAAIARQCRRVIPALLAASLLLVAWNVTATRRSASSVFQAALGIATSPAAVAPTQTNLTALEGVEAFQ